MPEGKNSITFDEERQELQIITYYDKQAYLDTCFREAWPVSVRCLLTTKDKALRRKATVFKFGHVGSLLWVLFLLLVFLKNSYKTLNIHELNFFIILALLYLFSTPLTIAAQGFLVSSHLIENLNRSIRDQWELANRLFERSEPYKQEVHITRTERCTVETTPYVPMVVIPGREYLKVLHAGDDVFFLQYGEQEKRHFGILLYPRTLHFKAQNYTAEEWELLISKLTALSYL